jgi:hypothetical protein
MKTKKKNLIIMCYMLLVFGLTLFSGFFTNNTANAESSDYYVVELDLRGIDLYAEAETAPSTYFSRNLQLALHFSDGTTSGKDIKITFKGGFTYKAMLVNGYQVYKLSFLEKRVFEISQEQYDYFDDYTLTNLHLNISAGQGRWNYIYKSFVDPYGGSNRELPLNLVTAKTVSAEPDPVLDLPIEEADYPATSEGVQAAVSADKTTMYYLKLPVKDLGFRIADKNFSAWKEGTGYHLVYSISPNTTFVWNLFEDAAVLANNRYHTFIITYNNIVVGEAEAALLTTWNIECRVTGWGNIFGGHITYYPKQDIEINIRSEYYELFQNGDFSDCTITYMYAGVGYKMRNPNDNMSDKYDLTGATLHTRDVPADYDPILEEGQAPDNGGVAVDPRPQQAFAWWDNVWQRVRSAGKGAIFFIVIIIGAVLIIRYAKPKK